MLCVGMFPPTNSLEALTTVGVRPECRVTSVWKVKSPELPSWERTIVEPYPHRAPNHHWDPLDELESSALCLCQRKNSLWSRYSRESSLRLCYMYVSACDGVSTTTIAILTLRDQLQCLDPLKKRTFGGRYCE